MNEIRFHTRPTHPILDTMPRTTNGCEVRRCASAHCRNLVFDPWEESGTLCASCAVEVDLADREGRWDRLAETVH